MNKNRLFQLIFLLLVGCCACNDTATPKPSHKIHIDSVAVMITDCYFLEGEIHVKQKTYDMKDYAIVKYDSFFYYHGTTKEIFVENVKYYFTNERYAEKLMNKVDTLVEQRVARLRDSLNSEQ